MTDPPLAVASPSSSITGITAPARSAARPPKSASKAFSARAASVSSGVSLASFAAPSKSAAKAQARALRTAVFAADKPDRSGADAKDAGKGQKVMVIGGGYCGVGHRPAPV